MIGIPPSADVTLCFRLPAALHLCVGPGRFQPCIHQARVDVGENFDVQIRAFNGLETEARRIVFDQARRFLVAIAGGRCNLPMTNFPGRLYERMRAPRYEHYEIVTGAAVSITRAFASPALVA